MVFTSIFSHLQKTPTPQLVMGISYSAMGLLPLLFPAATARLSFNENRLRASWHDAKGTFDPLLLFVSRCFGSQALMVGLLLLAVPDFGKAGYLAFGTAMIPYLLFDIFSYIPLPTPGQAAQKKNKTFETPYLSLFGALGDAAGNLLFLACCYLGYKSYSS